MTGSTITFDHLGVDRISSMFNICIICYWEWSIDYSIYSRVTIHCIKSSTWRPTAAAVGLWALITSQQLVTAAICGLSSTMENHGEMDQSIFEEMDKYKSWWRNGQIQELDEHCKQEKRFEPLFLSLFSSGAKVFSYNHYGKPTTGMNIIHQSNMSDVNES